MGSLGEKYVVAGVDMTDLYPVPFPDNLPTVELQTVSVAKLLSHDEQESQRIFAFCKDPGFFLLDLTDHPEGVRLLQDATDCCRLAKKLFTSLTIDQKREYKTRSAGGGAGIFDMGYFTRDILPSGDVKYNETMNFPVQDMFGYSSSPDFALPGWLEADEVELIKRTMRSGNTMGNIVLSGLEQSLQIANNKLQAAHRLEDPSGDFLRLLRYPGYDPAANADHLRFPAHKDAISLGLLFTWLGGLQLPAVDAERLAHEEISEASWRWARPVPGTAIVNMGDALELLTNGALTSGLHRVVRAPREQAPHDRYSVLLSLRPANTWPMTPLESPVIRPLTAAAKEAKAAAPVLTCAEWGAAKLKALGGRFTEREQRKERLNLKD
ncbi:oxidoreductase [Apodospora peruviana]|uniref:Oxidoreductase n=1 Tax=Apodospora peruviana TaxID=516989 RepID=A0AAE0HSF7_9PEZI|nr:oxidoreductase [Apodospora peruviana]